MPGWFPLLLFLLKWWGLGPLSQPVGLGHTGLLLYLQDLQQFPVKRTVLGRSLEMQTVQGVLKRQKDSERPLHSSQKLTGFQMKLTLSKCPLWTPTYMLDYSICCHHSTILGHCLGISLPRLLYFFQMPQNCLTLGVDSFLELAWSRLFWHPVCWLALVIILEIVFLVKSEAWQ